MEEGQAAARNRPLGIWIIVVLGIVSAILAISDALFDTRIRDSRFQLVLSEPELARAATVGWALLVIASAVWLWTMSRRAWALSMLLTGLALAAQLATWWYEPDETPWLRMVLAAVTAFYLNSSQVRDRYLWRHVVTRIPLGGRSST